MIPGGVGGGLQAAKSMGAGPGGQMMGMMAGGGHLSKIYDALFPSKSPSSTSGTPTDNQSEVNKVLARGVGPGQTQQGAQGTIDYPKNPRQQATPWFLPNWPSVKKLWGTGPKAPEATGPAPGKVTSSGGTNVPPISQPSGPMPDINVF